MQIRPLRRFDSPRRQDVKVAAMYGHGGVDYTPAAAKRLKEYQAAGFGSLWLPKPDAAQRRSTSEGSAYGLDPSTAKCSSCRLAPAVHAIRELSIYVRLVGSPCRAKPTTDGEITGVEVKAQSWAQKRSLSITASCRSIGEPLVDYEFSTR